jgi:hypothetical protein
MTKVILNLNHPAMNQTTMVLKGNSEKEMAVGVGAGGNNRARLQTVTIAMRYQSKATTQII